MKINSTVAVSAVALAVLSSFAVQGEPLKQIPAQSVKSESSPSTAKIKFADWFAERKRHDYADITDQIIVSFKEKGQSSALKAGANNTASKSDRTQSQRILNDLGNRAGHKLKFVKTDKNDRAILRLEKAKNRGDIAAIAKRMLKHKNVASVEPDPRRYPMAQSQPWGIANVQADQLSDNEAGNKTVCIIDSGYDINNSDLSANLVDGTDDPGTGSWATPGGSHGSHVAGTIAGINNSEGIVGVMPNQNINLHIIKVFNAEGWGYSTDLAGAIDKCAAAGADVVNMSLGGTGSSTAESNSLQSAYDSGILLVAASGNSGDASLSYPASYDSVIAVAAVDESGQHAEFSQYTAQVELSGPGEAILSTVGIADGRQGFLNFNGADVGDDRVLPQSRYVDSGGNFVITNVNGTVTGDLAACSRSGSTYSCGNMSAKICVAERAANQSGSTYPEIDPAKACADAGAAGVVVYSNSDRPGLQNPFLVDATSAVDVPTVSVNRTLGQQLLAAAGTSATLQVQGNTDYAYYNGTSMATPHVAGVAALAWSKNPTCTAVEVRNALKLTAIDLDVAGRDDRTGYGLVQTKAASDYLAANCGSGGGPGPDPSELENGVAVTGLAASQNQELSYTMVIPDGASDLSFDMSGGSGDADLYVKFGSAPTTSDYDCRPYKSGNAESCAFATPSAGTYYVKVIAYSTFSGLSLTGGFTEPSTGSGEGQTASLTNLSASRNAWLYYTWDVPAGMASLDVITTGGTGDADLYVRFGSQPSTSSYDCRPYKNGNEEVCTFSNPAAGTWHFGIRAYSAFSGVTLNTSYQP